MFIRSRNENYLSHDLIQRYNTAKFSSYSEEVFRLAPVTIRRQQTWNSIWCLFATRILLFARQLVQHFCLSAKHNETTNFLSSVYRPPMSFSAIPTDTTYEQTVLYRKHKYMYIIHVWLRAFIRQSKDIEKFCTNINEAIKSYILLRVYIYFFFFIWLKHTNTLYSTKAFYQSNSALITEIKFFQIKLMQKATKFIQAMSQQIRSVSSIWGISTHSLFQVYVRICRMLCELNTYLNGRYSCGYASFRHRSVYKKIIILSLHILKRDVNINISMALVLMAYL